MTCEQIKTSLATILGSVDCKEAAPGHVMVASPFMNIDGDHPEVHIIEAANGEIILTDYGESFRALANSNIDPQDSETRGEILVRIDSLLGIKHDRGRFSIQVSKETVGEGLHRMFQALAFVEDMIFTASPRDEQEFKNRVQSVLEPIAKADGGRIDRNQELRGSSGRKYNADFKVYRQWEVWIATISATTGGAFSNQVNRANAMWSDADKKVRSITIFDDSSPAMDESSVAFLQKESQRVARWSNLEGFQKDVIELSSLMAG